MKWLPPAVVVVLAVLAEVTLGRAAHAPELGLFVGRFHPLVVHLPIGFFLLVAMAEGATFVPKLRERVEPVIGLLIPVSAGAALLAFLMGQLLALEGGFPAAALGWHRRLTLIAVMGMAACWVVFDWQRGKLGSQRWAYRGVMGATLGVLSLGAHFGGTMTRGESYLSKYAPGPLKPLLGAPEPKKAAKEPAKAAPAVAEPLVFQSVVLPILTDRCVECHGGEKQKGKLRLDSLEELLKGGENGPVVVAGVPEKSPLLQRILLPASDDDRMPPEDKPRPKPEEIAILEFWIQRGASPTLKVKDVLAPTLSRGLLEHAAGETGKPSSVPVSAAPAEASKSGDAALAPSSAPSPSEPAAAPAGAAPATAKASAAASESAGAPAPEAAAEPVAAVTPEPAPAPALNGPGFLAAHCTKCHGPNKQKGKLRVDSFAALVAGGKNGAALVPGNPGKSSVVQRLHLPLTQDEHMPPKKEPQPSAAEIAAFTAWVKSGAGGSGASPAAAKPAAVSASESAKPSSAATATAAVAAPDSASSAGATTAFTGSASATDTPAASAPDSGAAPAADAATATPASGADVSGPPDPELLKSLPPQVVLFADAVQPLLREKCGKCHVRESPAGGLGVDQHKQLLEGGFSGAGIVPRDRGKSFLMARIILPPADDEHMPPEDEPQLSADEVELVGAFIDQGAPPSGATDVAKLTAGAVRALSARGVKAAPPALAAQSGGCAACSVPGAPRSGWIDTQALSLLAVTCLISVARRRRRQRGSLNRV